MRTLILRLEDEDYETITLLREALKRDGSLSDHNREELLAAIATADIANAQRDYVLAKSLIVVQERAGAAKLFIDGEPFPYATLDGFSVHPKRGNAPGVSCTLYADRVELISTMDGVTKDEKERLFGG